MSPATVSETKHAPDSRPVRGARSCTLCRQMKARCNATEQYPKPCSRCVHLNKGPCIIEPSFRRVNKRAKIAEIQSELEQLKQTVKQSSGSLMSQNSEYSEPRNSYAGPENAPHGHFSPESSNYGSPFMRSEDSFRPRGLTGRVDPASEEELFLAFFTKFHPTLPIVDNTLIPAQTFARCALLYHTILLLGTLATPNHSLTWPLCQTVTANAPALAFSTQKSIPLVQAFLLLATWPQTQAQGTAIHDQAWMYASTAVHMAQCLGLHRSFLSSEYAQSENLEDTRQQWVRTWVGCFIVSQFLSSALGVDPIVTEDFTIQNAAALLSPMNNSSYDPALSLLLDKLKMARTGARISGLLASCPHSSSGLADVGDNLAVFRVLQADIEEVESTLLNTDEARGLPFLWVKLQLYSFALHDGILPLAARSELIVRGFETSYLFLEVFSSIVSNTPMAVLPNLYSFTAVCAWMFVLKVMYSKYQMYLDIESKEATDQLLLEVQKVISSKSTSGGDFFWKAGIMMDTLLRDARSNDNSLVEPFLTIRSRMTAGLYHDGIARLNEITRPRQMSTSSVYETKVMLQSPPSVTISSHSSSPFLSSDDLSTPPTTDLTPSESSNGKTVSAEFWGGPQTLGGHLVAEPGKIDMEWLADAFLQGETPGAPGYVSPGLLMVQ